MNEAESTRYCTTCKQTFAFTTCSDRCHICPVCKAPIQWINSFRNFRQRVSYYRDALEQCMKVNTLILPFVCSTIASYCADPPRFGIGQKVDCYHDQKKYFIKSKVLEIKYGVTEQVLIEGTTSMIDGAKHPDEWMDAHDEKLKSLDIFRPNHDEDVIDVICGKCGVILFEELHPLQYIVDEATQPHFSFELFTNSNPKNENVCGLNGSGTMLNCKVNCHAPLWLIDHQSGYIDTHDYQYALACGRTYSVVRLNAKDTTPEIKENAVDLEED